MAANVRMRLFGSHPLLASGDRTFLGTLLFWNPLLAGAISFAFRGTHPFLRAWLVSLVISEIVALQCFGTAHLIRCVEAAFYRLRKRSAPVHGVGWDFVLAGLALPFALPVGLSAGGATARSLGMSWSVPDFNSYRNGLGFGLVMLLLFFFQRARGEAREMARAAEARIQSLEAARLQTQLSALTAEMNPHLLFNALNTVASLVHRDPDRAEHVLLELSDLYRGVLRTSGKPMQTLHEELALCKAYLNIEQARFGDRLIVNWHVAPDIDARSIQVPALILQPFVENAVKHGLSPLARGGRIDVSVLRKGQELEIRILDDGIGFGQSPHHGAGKAMANCKDRLRLTYGDRASLAIGDAPGSGTRVVLTVPVSVRAEDGAP